MLSSTTFFRATSRTRATTSSRYFHWTTLRRTATPLNKEGGSSGVIHTTDSYAKDVDTSPAPDHQVHRVDANSENVQKPYEAPSGQWSRAGVKTSEYDSINKTEQPYAPKEPEGERQRYGGKENWPNDKGRETSQPGEGPTGTDAGGRKAEGR